MRAQTTLDFAIGMSIFLVTVAFVVSFVPGMIQPFSVDSGEEVVAADRVANQLSRRLLTAGSQSFVLDFSCTEQFFDMSDASEEDSPSECLFEGRTLRERIGVAADANVNIQLAGDVDGDGQQNVLCTDGNGNVEEADDISCDTRLAAGGTPPDETGTVTVARRVVSIATREVSLVVRMW